ncbi:MAG: electron transfer flavoprotein subunit beta/FixA family protein [Betaproteobacteria bacterium]
MHIVVCVKQVPDPEAAFSMFQVDEAAKSVVPAPGLAMVMSPFDEQAVEAALRIRTQHAGAKITVLTLGPERARNALKHGLAMGADEGVLIRDELFDVADSSVTARALAAAIKKIAACDLVLAGRQAADRDAGVVGAGIAELLGWPVVTFVKDAQVNDAMLRVERVVDDGTEIVEADLPAVATVSNEIGPARTPNLRETMRAARKPIAVWNAADLDLNADALRPRNCIERVFTPTKQRRCMFIGGSVQEQAKALARELHTAHLI